MSPRDEDLAQLFIDYISVKKLVNELTQDYTENTILSKLKGKNIPKLLNEYKFIDINNKIQTKSFIYSVLKAIELERKDKNKLNSSIKIQMYSDFHNEINNMLNEDGQFKDFYKNNGKNLWNTHFLKKLNCVNVFKQFIVKNESQSSQKKRHKNIRKSGGISLVENKTNKQNYLVQTKQHDRIRENNSNYLQHEFESDTFMNKLEAGKKREANTQCDKLSISNIRNIQQNVQLNLSTSQNRKLLIIKTFHQQHWASLITKIIIEPIIYNYQPKKTVGFSHFFGTYFITTSTQTSQEINSTNDCNVFVQNFKTQMSLHNYENNNINVNEEINNSKNNNLKEESVSINENLDWRCCNSPTQIYEMCLGQLKLNAVASERIYSSSNCGSSDSDTSLYHKHLKDSDSIKEDSKSNLGLTLKQLRLHLNGKVKNNIKYFNQQNLPNNYYSNLIDYNNDNCEINKFNNKQNIYATRVLPISYRPRLFKSYSLNEIINLSTDESLASENMYVKMEKCDNNDKDVSETDSIHSVIKQDDKMARCAEPTSDIHSRRNVCSQGDHITAPIFLQNNTADVIAGTLLAGTTNIEQVNDIDRSSTPPSIQLNPPITAIQNNDNNDNNYTSKSLVLYNNRNHYNKKQTKKEHPFNKYNKNQQKCTIL